MATARASLVLGAVLLIAATAPAVAQRVPLDTAPDPDELRNIWDFQVENDFFNIVGKSDRDYTNGLRIGWLSPALPDLPDLLATITNFPTFFGEGPVTSVTRRLGISVGQNLYTPQDTEASFPIFNDRPYAAWLYASFALQEVYKRYNKQTGKNDPVRMDTIQLELGLVGPAAGGEFVQNNFHRAINDDVSNGWAFQLHNEPTIGLTFERRWRALQGVFLEDPKLEYDVIPAMGLAVGNVSDYLSAGGIVRIGKDLQADFGPPRARPAMPGSEGFVGDGFAWYFFVGATAQGVAHNMFLDGNTDGNDIVHVTHRPFVGEGTVGLALLFRGVRVSFTQVLRSPEFYERDRWDQ
ncbi:MAG: lipid A deacylase LpxR family protein, partial [Alphaproteobacteria bacterium]|nr:lipid A deacylase LpxR family protein [Alphaproteobacteria bacterium]